MHAGAVADNWRMECTAISFARRPTIIIINNICIDDKVVVANIRIMK